MGIVNCEFVNLKFNNLLILKFKIFKILIFLLFFPAPTLILVNWQIWHLFWRSRRVLGVDFRPIMGVKWGETKVKPRGDTNVPLKNQVWGRNKISK